MEIFDGIKKINLKEPYQADILGLGEVYEIMSVEKARKRLAKRYTDGELYLASNKSHSDRGLTLSELRCRLEKQGITVRQQGYTDSPPWLSKPLTKADKKSYSPIILFSAKIIFAFILPMEFIWQGPQRSHMIFCFSQKS